MCALGTVFHRGDVQHLSGHGDAVDSQRQPGEQKDLAHFKEHLVSQPPGVIIIAGVGGGLVQKAGDPRPLIAVAVGKYQLLLTEIAVFQQILLEILQNHSSFHPVCI